MQRIGFAGACLPYKELVGQCQLRKAVNKQLIFPCQTGICLECPETAKHHPALKGRIIKIKIVVVPALCQVCLFDNVPPQ